MSEERKSPEEILAKIKQDEEVSRRGRLKIFLGMAAGVGKTYAMLSAAQALIKEKVDVVAGLVVTHGRQDTEALLEGLEIIPERSVEYRGAKLKEFDLDAVLKRHPAIVLLDELAHTNMPGSRHEKRWQDVDELLQAGVSVYTTLNIQHLESVNDLVAQITQVEVRETVPDSTFDKAYEVELVDLPPDDLIQRLHEGKVYVPDYARTAIENFFKKGNLIALRELALRATAERVDAQMLEYRQETGPHDVWAVRERILVCVGPSPFSARLVRATRRMAARSGASWIAVYVETPGAARLSEKDRNRVVRNLELAQRLGAQTDRITDGNIAEGLIAYARRCNASKIVIGKPARSEFRERIFGSIVYELIKKSGNIDVNVITGDPSQSLAMRREKRKALPSVSRYLAAIAIVAAATLFTTLTTKFIAIVNLAMIYQLAVVIIALRLGKGPSLLASALAVAAFDFFCVPPYYQFAVADTQYFITFVVMFVIAITLSTLTTTVKAQAELARLREHQTAALYAMTREQATAIGADNIVNISAKHISDVFESKVVVLLADEKNVLKQVPLKSQTFDIDSNETGVAQWVHLNNQPAGVTTSTLSGARALYLPLTVSTGTIGVVGIIPSATERLATPDETHLLETFVNQTALAVERAQLAERRQPPGWH